MNHEQVDSILSGNQMICYLQDDSHGLISVQADNVNVGNVDVIQRPQLQSQMIYVYKELSVTA